MKQNKTGGVVVLYNPNIKETLSNIQTYINDLDILICIDNSNESHEKYLAEIPKITYIALGQNKGVSYALNLGCQKLIDMDCGILFTFDQDTFFEDRCIIKMVDLLIENEKICVSPNVKRVIRKDGKRVIKEPPMYPVDNEYVKWVITSGCGFSSSLYKKIKEFDSKLFIGQVDMDFCCAVYNSGGKVCRIGNIFMYQELGNAEERRFFWRKVFTPNLAPIRYYYVFRNERYLRKKWGKKYKGYKAPLLQYIVMVLLYEKRKKEKIYQMIRGYNQGRSLIHG